ncbi:MAG: Rrf2 family transcriptional regulator [Verrucomicrobiae bacterium]|nr:Rrf2 family transcriptional regulator [Verrucomicrobiae bacterium]
MKLSVKSDYAARAVLGLARHAASGAPVPIDALARDNGIPPNYLVQILLELKARNIVRSQRGKAGGYQLARPPSEITLGDIVRCVHGQAFDTPAMRDPQCPPELQQAWNRVRSDVEAALDRITFQQLADDDSAKAKMYYI